MKLMTFSDRAHHFQKVNDKVEEFCKGKKVSELKPFVTDSRYMIVVLYTETVKKASTK